MLEHRPLSAHRKKSHQHPRVSAQRLLSWHTPEELVFVLLRHSQCLISSRKSCANLIVILAIVTAAATKLASLHHTTRSLPKGCAVSAPLLRSSCKHTACSTMPARRASFSQLPALSGIALLTKLSSPISRDASVRNQCVSRYQYAPGRTECWSSDCSLNCGAGESNSRVVNGLCQAST